MDPLTGELGYVTNTYVMTDSLIHLGYGNTTTSGNLNTIIGYGNLLSEHSIAFGWSNQATCSENFLIGYNINCTSDKTITIGRGAGSVGIYTWMPGSIGLGMLTERATLHVHSGYGQLNNGYEGDIGGVIIGWTGAYNIPNAGLEINAHRDANNPKTNPPTAKFISTENDEWIVGMEEMTVAGSLSAGNISCSFVPHVYSGAADTSLLPTPLKTGDYYIDTSARDVYISTSATRGSWIKVN